MSVKNKIESLLFISHKPLSLKELVNFMGVTQEEVVQALSELEQEYSEKGGGIQMLKLEDKYQLSTSADSTDVVSKFIKAEITGELTKPSLEALTIIAYRGPISKAELELIRGVNCSMILRNLLMRGLIEAQEDKKKCITYYSITFDFLKHLGLGRVEDLPDFEKLNRNNNLEKLLQGLTSEMENGEVENNK